MTMRERVIMAPLIVLIVGLGVYPKPVLDRIAPSVDELVTHVERHSDFEAPHAPAVPAVAAGAEGGH
jgi:NADH-quinone oxidoreductase subunit M